MPLMVEPLVMLPNTRGAYESDGLTAYRQPDGSYRLSNEYHYLIARA